MHVARLQRDFVITEADKLGNNLVLVCKKHDVATIILATVWVIWPILLFTLNPAGSTTEDVVVDRLVTKLPGTYRDIWDSMYHTKRTVAALRTDLSLVPSAAALVKVHKTPTALRFLASSRRNGLKPPTLWLTALFCGVFSRT